MMAFEKLDRAPKADQYVDIIHKNDQDGAALLALPSLALMARERLSWRRLGRGHKESSLIGQMALSLTEHLNYLISIREKVAEVAKRVQFVTDESAAEAIATWYSQSATTVPYAKMMRTPEMLVAFTDSSIVFSDGKQLVVPDYDDSELDRSGLHVHDQSIGRIEGFSPLEMGEEVWYEGDEIFVRTRKPAEATILMNQTMRELGERFDRANYVTLAARMKTEAWLDN